MLNEKYRPRSAKEMIGNEISVNIFLMFSVSFPSPNLMVRGPCGSGKTSLVRGLLKEINKKKKNFIFLVIDGLEDKKTFQIKEKISIFINSAPADFMASKIIIIEELDSFSMNNQMSLRDILEKNVKETRFFVTCSNLSKVNLAVFSRCGLIQLKFPPSLFLIVRIKEICEKEKISINLEELKKVLEFGLGDTMKILKFLPILDFEKGEEKIVDYFLHEFKFIKILRYSKEIFLKDFQFIAFKKIQKFSDYYSFSFSKLIEKLQIKEKANISFF